MKIPQGSSLVVSVPCPVRLFGDMQYNLSLPAITAAVDMRSAVGATPRADGRFTFFAPWLSAPVTFRISELGRHKEVPFIERALAALEMNERDFTSGFDFRILSRLPVSEEFGRSSSVAAAMTIALLSLQDKLEKLSGMETSELALRVFSKEEPATRGTPEIFSSVLGGLLFVSPDKMPPASAIDRQVPGLVFAPGIRSFPSALPEDISSVLEKLKSLQPSISLHDSSLDEVISALRSLGEKEAGIAYALFTVRDLCRQAYELLESEYGCDDDRLAEMMDKEREMLHDYLGFDSPEAEALANTALEAGALGWKPDIASGGILFLAPGRQKEVAAAIRKAGGEASSVEIAAGMRVEVTQSSKTPLK